MNNIKVLVCDDHPLVRDGLCAGLGSERDITIVGQAENGLQAEEEAIKNKPDVIIMDIYMAQRNGLESTVAIKQKLPEVKILLLTMSGKEDDVMEAIRNGADGYLLKNTKVIEVVDAVRRIVNGEVVFSPAMTAKLVAELKRKDSEPALTRRENEIACFISEGLTTREIAKRLFLSQSTVSTHIYRILGKLQLRNRAEVAMYIARHGRNDY